MHDAEHVWPIKPSSYQYLEEIFWLVFVTLATFVQKKKKTWLRKKDNAASLSYNHDTAKINTFFFLLNKPYLSQ